MPSSTLDIPAWVPPKPTQEEGIEWAQLSTLDLSLVTGDEFDEIPEALVREADAAFRRDGFAYAINHGWTYEQVLRQFAIGQYGFQGVSEEEKSKYKADMLGKGSFVGYKNQGHWSINGVKDRIEQLNFGSQSFSPAARTALFPGALQSLIPEVEEFVKFNHDVILRKVLNVLSLVLKLPVHTLYDLSREPEKRGIDLLRYAMYHTPDKADDDKLGGVRLQGHTDFNSVSVLWSQPITSLEVLMPDNKWRLVKHADNAVVLNLGDAMHFLSGGYLKSCIHRVVAPPADQAHYTRLGCFYFALLNEDVPLETLDSPVIREALGGRDLWAETRAAGKKIPTAGEWERERVRRYGQGGAKKGDDGHEHEEMFGAKVTHYNGERAGHRAAVEA